jgi:hypothetical protein
MSRLGDVVSFGAGQDMRDPIKVGAATVTLADRPSAVVFRSKRGLVKIAVDDPARLVIDERLQGLIDMVFEGQVDSVEFIKDWSRFGW